MIYQLHLRRLIEETLFNLAYGMNKPNISDPAAIELLILTAAVESRGGSYLRQLGDGPARGIFQMEPNTEKSLFNHYLQYRKDVKNVVLSFDSPGDQDLEGNIPYQIVMARLKYFIVPKSLPSHTDVRGLAQYWKQYYNTPLGKGTVEKAIVKYNKYRNGESL